MSTLDVAPEPEAVANMDESQNERDKRVEDLWKRLDPAGHKELDFKGLQKGLRRIDHRKTRRPWENATNLADLVPRDGATAMKNADQMLRAIIGLVDTSGDGKIQYEGGFWRNGQEAYGWDWAKATSSQQSFESSSRPPSASCSCSSAPSIATRTAA